MSRAGTHILLVDDHPKALEVYEIRLKALGHRTTIAHNGEVAISVVERDRPDLVILDITMPEMNGYQACRAIKRIDPKIIVVMLTAKTEAADRFWAKQLGADDYLNKPIDPVVLVRHVEALLAKSA